MSDPATTTRKLPEDVHTLPDTANHRDFRQALVAAMHQDITDYGAGAVGRLVALFDTWSRRLHDRIDTLEVEVGLREEAAPVAEAPGKEVSGQMAALSTSINVSDPAGKAAEVCGQWEDKVTQLLEGQGYTVTASRTWGETSAASYLHGSKVDETTPAEAETPPAETSAAPPAEGAPADPGATA